MRHRKGGIWNKNAIPNRTRISSEIEEGEVVEVGTGVSHPCSLSPLYMSAPFSVLYCHCHPVQNAMQFLGTIRTYISSLFTVNNCLLFWIVPELSIVCTGELDL